MEKKYCSTCQWYDIETGVCCKGRSDYRADFRLLHDTCVEWKENPLPKAAAKPKQGLKKRNTY